jgi:hypothetical protein
MKDIDQRKLLTNITGLIPYKIIIDIGIVSFVYLNDINGSSQKNPRFIFGQTNSKKANATTAK